MVNGATISSVSRCRILHTSDGRWLSSSRGHFTRNEHKMEMCSCKMLSCLWLAEFVMSNEPVAMALTICRVSWCQQPEACHKQVCFWRAHIKILCTLVDWYASLFLATTSPEDWLAVMLLLCAAVILVHGTLRV